MAHAPVAGTRTSGPRVPSAHRAARVEEAVHDFLEPRLRERGWRDTLVAYTGYGTPSDERLATARSDEGRRRLTLSITPS